jgi:hypothetical protein
MLSSVKARSRTSEFPLVQAHARDTFFELFNARLQIPIGEFIISFGFGPWNKQCSIRTIFSLLLASTSMARAEQHKSP